MSIEQKKSLHLLSKKLIEHFVSPLVGLAHKIEVCCDDEVTLGFFVVGIVPAHQELFSEGVPMDFTGGVAVDQNQAIISGLMEFAERYSGLYGGQFRVQSDVPNPARDLVGDRLPLFARWQYKEQDFPFKPVSEKHPIRLIRVRHLGSQCDVRAPLSWIRVPCRMRNEHEVIAFSNSNGLAAGFNRSEATLSGLLEVCERDAFMLMWYGRKWPAILSVDVGTLFGKAEADRVTRLGLECRFFNLTNDLQIPTALCMFRTDAPGSAFPKFSLGVASRSSILEACRKAFFEAVGERLRLHTLMKQPKYKSWQPGEDFSNVKDFSDHSLLYTLPNFSSILEELWMGDGQYIEYQEVKKLPSDPKKALLKICGDFAEKGIEIYVVPLETEECRAVGIKVVKVIAPKLVPLVADHRYPFLGAPRLWESLGFMNGKVPESLPNFSEINLMPHPLS